MKAKTSNRTIKKKISTKKLSWYERYMLMNAMKDCVSEKFIDRLVVEIFEHFENKKNICILEFVTDKGVLYETFLEWTERFPRLGEVYKLVKQRLGDRREKLAMFKDYNCEPKTIHFTLRHYNPFWRKSLTEDNEATEKGGNEQRIVVIEKFKDE